MNEYPLNGQAYVFTDTRLLGNLVNPASLALHFRTADGAVAIYTLAGGQVQQGVQGVPDATATGRFYYIYTAVVPGTVSYAWYSGTVPIGEGAFSVAPPRA